MKKNIFLFSFLFISIFGLTQNKSENILEGLWRIDEVMGVHPSSSEYNLYNPTENQIKYTWGSESMGIVSEKTIGLGSGINFNSNGTFSSGYSAWCGNDCFRSSKGTFELIDDTHIHLKVDSVSFTRYCQKANIGYQDLGIFLIKKQEDGYRLIKCPAGISDTQCGEYSDMANNLPKIKNDSSYREVRLLSKTQEKEDIEILKAGLNNISYLDLDPNKIQLLYTYTPSSSVYISNSEKRFVFEYNDKILVAIYHSGSSEFILYYNNQISEK